MAHTGIEEQWSESLTNEEQWSTSLSNDEQWMSSLGAAITRYARLILQTTAEVYHTIAKSDTFIMRVKDKIYHMITKSSRRY